MIINNNNIAGKSYTNYSQNLQSLSESASRLSTGEKFANQSHGAGELGIAHRFRNNYVGTNALLSGFVNADSLVKTQDEILQSVEEIITRMQEMAATGVDPTKTDDDRDALEVEFRQLSTEVANVALNAQFNGGRVFQTNRTLRVGMETGELMSLSQIQLSLLTFTSISLSTITTASAAIISLRSRAKSLVTLRAKSRSYSDRITRMLSYTRDYVANLSEAESALKNIDVAVESGNYTKKQVLLNSSQAILASANGLPQQALRFLDF